MKILVVCQHYWPEPFNVSTICEMLAARGHDVTVVTGLPNCPQGVVQESYKHGKKRIEEHNGVTVRRSWLVPRGADLRGFNKLRRVANYLSFAWTASNKALVRDTEFDVVLCVQYSPVLMAIPALKHARRRKVPCIIHSYDLWPEDLMTGGMSKTSLAYRIMWHASKKIYEAADVVAVTSPDFEKYFRDNLKIDGIECSFLPQFAEEIFEKMSPHGASGEDAESASGCTDLAAEKPAVDSPHELLRSQGTAVAEKVDITFAGNVAANQAIDNVVRAAALVKGDSRIRVNIVGSGSQLDACQALAAELGANNVIFHGRRPLEDVPTFYEQADALLLPLASADNGSLVTRYTIPRKMQSYLAAGKPVICSAEGVCSKLVRDNGLGIACSAGTPKSLADAFIAFANLSFSERRLMGVHARELYDREYSRAQFADRLEKLLEQEIDDFRRV